jgi:Ni2+-binding GTPase involved in maturation of urease and hydrogenase
MFQHSSFYLVKVWPGSGKTRAVEAAAEALFGDPHAMVKIDCAEFQHSHEISKLTGSPPGYLGHGETPPLLTQENLSRLAYKEAALEPRTVGRGASFELLKLTW